MKESIESNNMDWDRIERDLHAHAYAAASIPKIPTQISTSSPFKENNGIVLNSNGTFLHLLLDCNLKLC